MDRQATIAAVLRAVNDRTVVHSYGDGLLVDLPLYYGDSDSVRVLVEPMGTDGVRVSDRGTAATLLAMAGVDIATGRPAEAIAEAVRSAGLNSVNATVGEIATFGRVAELGELILNVAQASMRVDQLRWLAKPQPVTFANRVADRVKAWAGTAREVRLTAPIPLKSGRSRPVTAAVMGRGATAYVQALSARDRDRAAEHCYYLFDLATAVPAARKIAALDGTRQTWPQEIVMELEEVGDVEFFEHPTSLERHLERAVPLADRLATQSSKD